MREGNDTLYEPSVDDPNAKQSSRRINASEIVPESAIGGQNAVGNILTKGQDVVALLYEHGKDQSALTNTHDQ